MTRVCRLAPTVTTQVGQLTETLPRAVEQIRERVSQYQLGQWVLEHLPRGKLYALDSSPDMIAKLQASLDERGIQNVVAQRADLADFALPEQVDVVFTSLPKTSTGKVRKAVLRESVVRDLPVIAHALATVASRREWNLKVGYNPVELARHGAEVSPELRRTDEEIAAAPPGRRYLLERRRADTLKKEISNAARILAGELTPLEGRVRVGENVSLGYMPQQQSALDPEATPLSLVRDAAPLDETEAPLFTAMLPDVETQHLVEDADALEAGTAFVVLGRATDSVGGSGGSHGGSGYGIARSVRRCDALAMAPWTSVRSSG